MAKQLGILNQYGTPAGMGFSGYDPDTVLPTVIMTDAEGKLIFVDITGNYRIRPEPEPSIRIFDEHFASLTVDKS